MAAAEKPSVPSAARALSSVEALDLADLARGLPSGWVVTIEPPYGQVTILPRSLLKLSVRCHVADADLGVIYRMDARAGIRSPKPAQPRRRSSPNP